MEGPRVIAHLLPAHGAIPNHPRWPLLVYRRGRAQRFRSGVVFERLFDAIAGHRVAGGVFRTTTTSTAPRGARRLCNR
jgi:uncharacterized protein YjlB